MRRMFQTCQPRLEGTLLPAHQLTAKCVRVQANSASIKLHLILLHFESSEQFKILFGLPFSLSTITSQLYRFQTCVLRNSLT